MQILLLPSTARVTRGKFLIFLSLGFPTCKMGIKPVVQGG